MATTIAELEDAIRAHIIKPRACSNMSKRLADRCLELCEEFRSLSSSSRIQFQEWLEKLLSTASDFICVFHEPKWFLQDFKPDISFMGINRELANLRLEMMSKSSVVESLPSEADVLDKEIDSLQKVHDQIDRQTDAVKLRKVLRDMLLSADIRESDVSEALSFLEELSQDSSEPIGTQFLREIQNQISRRLLSVFGTAYRHEFVFRSGVTRGEFELHEQIGQGACSTVYRATYQANTIAVKAVTKFHANGEDVNLIMREIRYYRHLRCPFVAELYGFCMADKMYMLLEYATFGSLARVYTQCPEVLDQDLCYAWLIDLSHALEFLHRKSVIHRDIKCDNVLIFEGLKAKLGDFGLAGANNERRSIVGTVSFMAPEMLSSNGYGSSADIYSFGVAIYELTHRKVPQSDEKLVLPLSAPTELDELMQQCLQRDPASRPSIEYVTEVLEMLMEQTYHGDPRQNRQRRDKLSSLITRVRLQHTEPSATVTPDICSTGRTTDERTSSLTQASTKMSEANLLSPQVDSNDMEYVMDLARWMIVKASLRRDSAEKYAVKMVSLKCHNLKRLVHRVENDEKFLSENIGMDELDANDVCQALAEEGQSLPSSSWRRDSFSSARFTSGSVATSSVFQSTLPLLYTPETRSSARKSFIRLFDGSADQMRIVLDCGLCKKLVDDLDRVRISDAMQVGEALFCIRQLAMKGSPGIIAALGQAGVCEVLLAVMKSNLNDETISVIACETARYLLSSEYNHGSLAKGNFWILVFSVMKIHRRSTELVREGMLVFHLLTTVQCLYIGDHCELLNVQDERVYEAVSQVISVHSDNAQIMDLTSKVIVGLCDRSSQCAEQLATDGACESVSAALLTHVNNSMNVESGCRALSALARESHNKAHLTRSRASETLVTALTRHLTTSALCCVILRTVRDIAIENPSVKTQLMESRIWDALSLALERNRGDIEIVEAVSDLCCELVSSSEMHSQLFVSRTFSVLIQHLELRLSSPNVVKNTAHSITNACLSGSPTTTEIMRGSGALNLLVKSLKINMDNAATTGAVCRAIAALYDSTLGPLDLNGVVDLVVLALERHAYVATSAKGIFLAVEALIQNNQHLTRFRTSGGLELLIQSVKSCREDSLIAETFCRVIIILWPGDWEGKDTLTEDLCDTVVTILSQNNTICQAAREACAVVNLLVAESESTSRALAERAVAPALVRVARAFPHDSLLVKRVMTGVVLLLQTTNASMVGCTTQELSSIAAGLGNLHFEEQDVARHASRAMRLLCTTSNAAEQLTRSGACQALTRFLDIHMDDALIADDASATLYSLGSRSTNTWEYLHASLASGWVVKAVYKHLSSATIVQNVCGLIFLVGQNSPRCSSALLDEPDIVTYLVEAIHEHSKEVQVCVQICNALSVLVKNDRGKEFALDAGAFQYLKLILSEQIESPVLVEAVCRVVARLTQSIPDNLGMVLAKNLNAVDTLINTATSIMCSRVEGGSEIDNALRESCYAVSALAQALSSSFVGTDISETVVRALQHSSSAPNAAAACCAVSRLVKSLQVDRAALFSRRCCELTIRKLESFVADAKVSEFALKAILHLYDSDATCEQFLGCAKVLELAVQVIETHKDSLKPSRAAHAVIRQCVDRRQMDVPSEHASALLASLTNFVGDEEIALDCCTSLETLVHAQQWASLVPCDTIVTLLCCHVRAEEIFSHGLSVILTLLRENTSTRDCLRRSCITDVLLTSFKHHSAVSDIVETACCIISEGNTPELYGTRTLAAIFTTLEIQIANGPTVQSICECISLLSECKKARQTLRSSNATELLVTVLQTHQGSLDVATHVGLAIGKCCEDHPSLKAAFHRASAVGLLSSVLRSWIHDDPDKLIDILWPMRVLVTGANKLSPENRVSTFDSLVLTLRTYETHEVLVEHALECIHVLLADHNLDNRNAASQSGVVEALVSVLQNLMSHENITRLACNILKRMAKTARRLSFNGLRARNSDSVVEKIQGTQALMLLHSANERYGDRDWSVKIKAAIDRLI